MKENNHVYLKNTVFSKGFFLILSCPNDLSFTVWTPFTKINTEGNYLHGTIA